MKKNKLVQPFLKWAGGKRYIIESILKSKPKDFDIYYEPFLGAGAVLFEIQPAKAIINDLNEELINTYLIIKNNVENLINDLRKHKNDSDYYYKIRELDRHKSYKGLSDLEKASRIIYLNKTCYNGLFRVNSQGYFNVPFGKYTNPNILNEQVLRTVSEYLNYADISFLNKDFEESLKNIDKGSFVYFDPPYDPISDSSSFTGYNLHGFKKEDQLRLKKSCDRLHSIGCNFLLSNSFTEFILDLYKDYKIEIIKSNRTINSNASKRGEINEVLIKNYD